MSKLYAALIGHRVLANVVLVAVIALAIVAAKSITRESEPDITIPRIDIVTAYPGADPEEVEESITRRIEGAIASIQGIKRFISTSGEGTSDIEIELQDGVSLDTVKERIRNAVEAIQSFPEDAERPEIYQPVEIEEVLNVMVWGEIPERQLKAFAEEIRLEIQSLPEVSQVSMYNTRPYEISVEIPSTDLDRFGLTLSEVSHAVQRAHVESAGGAMPLQGEEIRLRSNGRRRVGLDFEGIPVATRTDGTVVVLGDIARIDDGFEETPQLARYNGHTAVSLWVEKAAGEDALTICDAVKRYLEAERLTLPDGVHLDVRFDQTEFVRSQLRLITRNGLLGLCLVLFVLWLFLEARLAFWVAMGIPISLGGALILLWLGGASINQISLVAMIVVMGIIVDDAIVVGEAIFVHRRMGKTPTNASIDALKEVGIPVFASVSTTIIAFMPLMFIPGIFGQFSRQMPIVVIAALTISIVECLFLLPAHLNHPMSRRERSRHAFWRLNPKPTVERGLEYVVERMYMPSVRFAVRYRYVTLCAGLGLIVMTGGLIAGGHLPVVMWPAVESDYVDAEVEYPPGTPPAKVIEATLALEEAALRAAESLPTATGEALLASVYTVAPIAAGTSGEVAVELLPAGRRGVLQSDFIRRWREEFGEIPGMLSVAFHGESIGNTGGADLGYWLQGRDYDELRSASASLREKLGEYEGVFQIRDNFRAGKTELHVSLKPSAHSLGLTESAIASQLANAYLGDEALRLQRGREEMRVRIRLPREERATWLGFDQFRVETPAGQRVPLQSVADIEMHSGVSSIISNDGVRGVYVTAAVDRKAANSGEVHADVVATVLPAIVEEFPGVTWSLAGAEQENQEFMAILGRNSLICIMAIFIILATVFRSYIQPLIIMFIIPFGLVGAAMGHLLMGIPLSFLSFGGITALAGVLVNDSIVLIERINTNIHDGMRLEDAVCAAGRRRFRAIFLTSVSTCVGLAPLIAETDLMAQVVIPMAVSIASGVALGTILTLVLIPAFLMIMNDARRTAHWLANGRWPSPEEVEPARNRGDIHAHNHRAAAPNEEVVSA